MAHVIAVPADSPYQDLSDLLNAASDATGFDCIRRWDWRSESLCWIDVGERFAQHGRSGPRNFASRSPAAEQSVLRVCLVGIAR